MCKLSVIVPVYRAEKFLDRCIESILSQKADLELILVDDGSPDASGEICDCWGRRDPRVRVFHQENDGVSAARNRGLDAARGQWLGFVDSDDFVADSMYEKMLAAAGSAQVVMCDFLTLWEDGREAQDTIPMLETSCRLRHGDFYPELLIHFAQSACRCIYRRDHIEKHGIRFPVGLKFSEDRVFNFYAMGYAREIQYLKDPLYIRYVNLDSCVNTFHPDYAIHGRRAAEETQKALAAAWDNDPVLQSAFLEQYSGTFYNSLNQLRQPHCPLNLFKRLQKVREICSNSDFRDILKEKGYGGREGQLILKRHYIHVYFYESWLDLKLLNVQELYEEAGMKGILLKCIRKLPGMDR